MDFRFDEDQLAWREEVRAFLDEALTPELVEEQRRWHGHGQGELSRTFYRRLAAKNWTALTWPKEFGGLDKSAVDQFILSEEFEFRGAPRIEMTWTSLAPLIMKYGTAENLADWIEPIRRGEVLLALGYSEPEAGTDLASLRTSAVRDGDEWVINGEKTWNTMAHFASHEWLAVRTNPNEKRHRGVSILIVPLDAPGVRVFPIETWSGVRTNRVTFDDVRVPLRNLIGEVDRGWQYITGALDFERATIGGHVGSLRRLLVELRARLESRSDSGVRLIDDVRIRSEFAELEAEVYAAGLMSFRVAHSLDRGEIPTVSGTMQKIYTTELRSRVSEVGMTLLGREGHLDSKDPEVPLGGFLEWTYRWAPVQRFGGGTNEVMRDVVAQRGLGLPRVPRAATK